MPSISSEADRPGAAGATTRTVIPSPRRATARRRINEPAASPSDRGNECVRNSTFIESAVAGRVAFLGQVFDSGPQLVHLGALRGDHLAQQAGGEENAADRDAGLHEIDQRSKANPADNSPEYRDDSDAHADDEQNGAEEAEQEERLSGEAKLEPDGQHVQHPDRDSSDAELRLSRISRIKRHRHLRYGKPARHRHHHHVPMPVRPVGQAVHHFAPIGLHRIQVADADLEQRPAQTVVDTRHESLLVLPFLIPGDNVRLASENGSDQARNVFRLVLQIGGIKDEYVTAGMQISGAQGVGDAATRAVSHWLEERILGGEALQHVPGVVDRAIVDDDDLVAMGSAGEHRLCLLHEQWKILGLVLGGNENADVGPAGRGLKRTAALEALRRVSLRSRRHTRLRIRAERTPSWSRYLATVRRAIWTPLSRRIFTIA